MSQSESAHAGFDPCIEWQHKIEGKETHFARSLPGNSGRGKGEKKKAETSSDIFRLQELGLFPWMMTLSRRLMSSSPSEYIWILDIRHPKTSCFLEFTLHPLRTVDSSYSSRKGFPVSRGPKDDR